jgi:DNA repair exonuclease SbcCD ATPase subunit
MSDSCLGRIFQGLGMIFAICILVAIVQEYNARKRRQAREEEERVTYSSDSDEAPARSPSRGKKNTGIEDGQLVILSPPPKTFCQILQQELDRYNDQLDNSIHHLLMERQKLQRERGNDQMLLVARRRALDEMRAAYRDAEGNGNIPVIFRGAAWTRQEAKAKIREAEQRVAALEKRVRQPQNLSVLIDRRVAEFQRLQQRVAHTQQELQDLARMLETRKHLEKSTEISQRLDRLKDKIAAIKADAPAPTIDDLLAAPPKDDDDALPGELPDAI